MKKSVFVSTLIAAAAMAAPTFAANITWTGSVDGTWNTTTANWSGDETPTTFNTDDNVTFDGTDSQTSITLGDSITAGNITFTEGGYTISNGNGTSLTAGTLAVQGADGSSVTIDVTTANFTSISLANHGGDNENDEYKHLVFGNGTSTTTVIVTETLSLLGQSEVQVAANSTLTVNAITSGGGFHTSISGAGTLTAGSLTQDGGNNQLDISIANLQVTTFTVTSGTALTFSGGSTTIGTLNVNDTLTLTFTGEGTYSIGSYVQSAGAATGMTFAIGANTTVTVGSYSASWHEERSFGEGSALTVTEELSLHTDNTEVFSGGTVNAEKINVYHSSNASFSDGYLNVGSGGIISYGDNNTGCHVIFGDDLTVGVYAGVNENNTSWSSSVDIEFTGTTTGTTFSTKTDETITLGGTLTGTGFTNTGSGTLTLSGTLALSDVITNLGTITISEGTTFVLDNLEAIYSEGVGYYEIIVSDGGSVSYSDTDGAYTFSYDGDVLDGWTIAKDSDGNIWVYGEVGALTWAGNDTSYTWNYTDENWIVAGGTTKTKFEEGDRATFGTDGYGTVNITENVKPGAITVEDDYEFITSNTEGVTVDASGVLTVAEGKTLTIGEGVTLYIDDVESNFSVDGKIEGTGTIEIDLTGGTGNYGSTINLGEGNEFAGIVYIHAGDFTLNDSDIGNGTYELADGVGMQVNAGTSITLENDLIIDGTVDLHLNTNASSGGPSSLEIAGKLSGEGTLSLQAGGTLTITGEVDLGTFALGAGATVIFADAEETSTSVKLGALTIAASVTVTFNKDATIGTGTGTAVTFTAPGTLTVGEDATLTVLGDIIDATSSQMTHITIGKNSTMAVDGTIALSPGVAGSNDSTISGYSSDSSTLVAKQFIVGGTAEDSGGSAIEVSNVTLVVGALSFGNGKSSFFDLYLKDATLGFTNDVTIVTTNVSGSTSNFVLGGYVTGNSSDTGTGTTTTINTSKYDTESGNFASTGVTVTISQVISGHGALVVEGTGTLKLSTANTFDGGLTIKSGTVVSQNASALGAGNVTVSGGNLQVDVATTVTGTITFSNEGKLIVSQTLLETAAGELEEGKTASVAIISANTITFGDVTLSGDGDVTSDVADWATAQAGQYVITGWTYADGTLYAVVALPEPSMFGLFFGFGAIGLVATRRRRRRVA